MLIYDLFFLAFSIIYIPYLILKGKAHRDFLQRFGMLPEAIKLAGKTKPIWIHAVSVGEVLAVKDFIKKIQAKFPGLKIILSTTTKTGNDVAKKALGKDVLKCYFPLDFSFVVKSVINSINPSVFIMMETEIWPNLILELSKRKIPIILTNGRISDKSFRGYSKIKPFFSGILRKISLFCMRTDADAKRIIDLGAESEKVRITGNMKFDVEEVKKSRDIIAAKFSLGIDDSSELIMAGSTHNNEEEMLLDVYKKLLGVKGNLRLLIAPRHIERSKLVKRIAEQKGFEATLLSELRKAEDKSSFKNSVLILDTLGELGGLYDLATVVFLGGSLIRRGGHNIVEPALFGKAIVFGHHMFNFRDMAKSFLENNAATEVMDTDALFNTLKELILDKKRRDIVGNNARDLIDRSKGAIEKNANLLAQFISRKGVI